MHLLLEKEEAKYLKEILSVLRDAAEQNMLSATAEERLIEIGKVIAYKNLFE